MRFLIGPGLLLALLIAVSVRVSAAEDDYYKLLYDADLIEAIGNQEPSMCSAYSLAYARTILDGVQADPYSYWVGGVGASWRSAGFTSIENPGRDYVLTHTYEELLNGRPVIVYVTGNYSLSGDRHSYTSHYVCVVGYRKDADPSSLKPSDFMALDPSAWAPVKLFVINDDQFQGYTRFVHTTGEGVETDIGNGKTRSDLIAEENLAATGFKDVAPDAYYADAVMWAAREGITGGMEEGIFAPEEPCSRAQVVTFLWRNGGRIEPGEIRHLFADVTDVNEYFYKPVYRAYERQITSGVSDDLFAPNAPCTRGQVVTFLWRSGGGTMPFDMISPFRDVNNAEDYYYYPVLWAKEQEITAGSGTGDLFAPDESCTRGQIVTFLYRWALRR